MSMLKAILFPKWIRGNLGVLGVLGVVALGAGMVALGAQCLYGQEHVSHNSGKKGCNDRTDRLNDTNRSIYYDKITHCYTTCLLNRCFLKQDRITWTLGHWWEVLWEGVGEIGWRDKSPYDKEDIKANEIGIAKSYESGDCKKHCECHYKRKQ